MSFQTLDGLDCKDKVVLLRVDLNVPAKDGAVTDTTRIDRLKETVTYLHQKGAKTAILSHFGRPKGEKKEEFSLSFLPAVLEKQWGLPVAFADDCVGDAAKSAVEKLNSGDLLLLENVRFHKGEEANDPSFAQELAKLGDIYINDAFSASHRAHASTEGLARLKPSYAGLLMQAELTALENALTTPKRPVIAFVGGAKISTKLSVLHNMTEKVDYLFLGGGMANTFLYAKGVDVGKSLCETDMAEEVKSIMEKAESNDCRIILPTDVITVKTLEENADYETVDVSDIAADTMVVDNGPETVKSLQAVIDECQTVLWNGPLGVFEIKPFDKATNDVARYVAEKSAEGKVVSVAGGGDTVAALENAGASKGFSYISTAGGAFLEWLEGKELPGVAVLYEGQAAA